MRSQLCLQIKASNASSKGGQVIGFVQYQEAVQATGIDGERRGITCQGIDVANDAGTPAIGNQVGPDLARVANQFAYLARAFRIGDPVREGINTAAAQGDPVGQTLPARMAYPCYGISRDAGAHRQPGRREARGDFF